jgi:hypothetical protein
MEPVPEVREYVYGAEPPVAVNVLVSFTTIVNVIGEIVGEGVGVVVGVGVGAGLEPKIADSWSVEPPPHPDKMHIIMSIKARMAQRVFILNLSDL